MTFSQALLNRFQVRFDKKLTTQRNSGMQSKSSSFSTTTPNQPSPQQQRQRNRPPPPQPSNEFDDPASYMAHLKNEFASSPDSFKKVLEHLHAFQEEQRSAIDNFLDETSGHFRDHPHLFKDFTHFLLNDVQEQTKLQLQKAVKINGVEKKKNAIDLNQANKVHTPSEMLPKNNHFTNVKLIEKSQINDEMEMRQEYSSMKLHDEVRWNIV